MMPRWRDWPWSVKLTVLLGILAVVPLSVVTLLHNFVVREDLLASTRARNLQQARSTAQAIDLHLERVLSDVRVLALLPWTTRFLDEPDHPDLRREVEAALRHMRDTHSFDAILLTDGGGIARLATDPSLVGRSYVASQPFLQAIAGSPGFTMPRWDPRDGDVFLQASAPVRGPDGGIKGVLIGRMSLTRIDEIVMADTNFGGHDEIGILWDTDGIRMSNPAQPGFRFRPLEPLPSDTAARLIAESRFGPRTRDLLEPPEPAPGFVQRSRWLLYDEASAPHLRQEVGGRTVHATIVPLTSIRWLYGIVSSESAILSDLRDQTRRDLSVVLLTALLSIALGLAAARWATRPLRLVGQTANAIAAGDMSRRVGLRQGDEVGRLAAAFDTMADALGGKETELRQHAMQLERRMEEQTAALRASEAELRALFAAMRDSIFIFDDQGRCLKVAPTRAASNSRIINQLRGRRLHDVFPEDQAQWFLDHILQALDTWQTVYLEYDLVVEGSGVWLEAAITPLLERSVVWVARDITWRRLGEEERRELLLREQEARRRSEDANRIKDEFLSTLSHELRTPLNAILGWTWLMRSGSLDEEGMQRAVTTVERNAKSQSQIIDDLLDVSRIITGKLRLKVRRVDLPQVIEAATDAMRPAAAAKEIEIETFFDPEVPPVSGDPNRLQQVIWNLLSNAVKFTPEGGRIEIHLERSGPQASIRVLDSGIGIRLDFLEYVFDRFRQADSSTTRLHGGLGLGLAIVRHLVELHGGTVRAESRGEGQGSAFTVTLPVTPLRSPRPAEPVIHHAGEDSEPVAGAEEIRGLRVLVVDDEPDAREVLPNVLERFGAQVRVSASGVEALEILRREGADVLVADIGMPGMDGYELIRRIRALDGGLRHLPAIALTAYAGDGDRRSALEAGFQLHLAKPVEPSRLAAAIARVTGRVAGRTVADPEAIPGAPPTSPA
jgi:PAS domain S-box-containing protein